MKEYEVGWREKKFVIEKDGVDEKDIGKLNNLATVLPWFECWRGIIKAEEGMKGKKANETAIVFDAELVQLDDTALAINPYGWLAL